MANQRISRSRKRELEQPDEFISLTGKFIRFISENSKTVAAALIIVLLGAAIYSGLHYNSIRTEKKAGLKLDEIVDKIEKDRAGSPPDEIYKSLKPEFETLFQQYPGKKATVVAEVMLADIAFKAGDLDTAETLYSRALKEMDEQDFYRNQVLKNLSFIFEQKKNYPEAINRLEIVLKTSAPEMKDEVLFNLAGFYAANQQKDKEAESYKKIIAEFPDSEYAKMAKAKLN